MMMKDSANEIIWKAYPEMKSGMKWSAVNAANKDKIIIGVTQTNQAGLGSTSTKVFSKVGPRKKRHGEQRSQDV